MTQTGLLCCCLLLLVSCAIWAQAPRVMSTTLPAEDLPVAQFVVTEAPYNAASDGNTDCTAAFQQAIDDAAALGGAVVFAPAGTYRFDGELRLKKGVSLRGEWVQPDKVEGKVVGTILAIYAGKGQVDGTPFLTMEKVSCVRNLSFWYPEQSVEAPSPYPWTITVTDESSCGYTVRNVTFVNSWRALSNGAETSRGYNVAYYSNLYGTPLNHGIWIELVLDITRIDRVHFAPRYWEKSGLPSAPESDEAKQALSELLYNQATGITLRRFDWAPLYEVELQGYGLGIHLTSKPDGPPVWQGPANGEMYGCQITEGRIGLLVDAAQHPAWLISKCTIETAPGEDNGAVVGGSGLKYAVQFHSCTVGPVKLEPGSSGAFTFESCQITGPASSEGGLLGFVNCSFEEDASISLGSAARGAVLAGCNLPMEAVKASKADQVSYLEAPPKLELPYHPYPYVQPKGPATQKLFDVREYGAQGDEVTDDAPAFQAALEAAQEAGGGTVYVPAGHYRISSPLLVPSGVELRGIFEGPTHTMVPGSCLFVDCGEGQEDGAPFISLQAGAGARGLVLWYPKQDLAALQPYPWTIRALGPDCWVRDVALANPWQAVDFASASETGGHVIQGLTGAPLRRGLFVDNASTPGYVANVQFVIHYWDRNDSHFPGTLPATQAGIDFMAAQLEAFNFGRCADEFVFQTFVYADRLGLALGDGFRGTVHLHGSDAAEIGVQVSGDAEVQLVNTNCAPFMGSRPTGLVTTEDFTGRLELVNSSFWGYGHALDLRGQGTVEVRQANLALARSWVENPNARLVGLYGATGQHTVQLAAGAGRIEPICLANCQVVEPPFTGRLLSQGARTTASSSHSEGEGPERAVDGLPESKWTSGAGASHWLELDLGTPCELTGLELIHEGFVHEAQYTTRDFKLLARASEEGDWTLLGEYLGNSEPRTLLPVEGVYQHIRLEVTHGSQFEDTYARIPELRIYGVPVEAGD